MKKIITTATLLSLGLTGAYADTNNVVEDAIEDIKDLNETGLYRPHFALMGGINAPIENDYQAGEMIALDVGYQVKVPYGLGAEISTTTFENDDRSNLTRDQFFVKGSYHFSDDNPLIGHSYAGLGLGIVSESDGDTVSYGAIMPNVGFDFPLEEFDQNLSLGANARYTATASNEADNFGISGVVKYWY